MLGDVGVYTIDVWARVALVGYHRWPNAPENRAYLRDRHRHQFVVEPHVRVSHHDRDIEFHDLRDLVEAWWSPERGAQSCEHIALDLREELTHRHGLTVTEVTVSEDGYEGATLRWVTP